MTDDPALAAARRYFSERVTLPRERAPRPPQPRVGPPYPELDTLDEFVARWERCGCGCRCKRSSHP